MSPFDKTFTPGHGLLHRVPLTKARWPLCSPQVQGDHLVGIRVRHPDGVVIGIRYVELTGAYAHVPRLAKQDQTALYFAPLTALALP